MEFFALYILIQWIHKTNRGLKSLILCFFSVWCHVFLMGRNHIFWGSDVGWKKWWTALKFHTFPRLFSQCWRLLRNSDCVCVCVCCVCGRCVFLACSHGSVSVYCLRFSLLGEDFFLVNYFVLSSRYVWGKCSNLGSDFTLWKLGLHNIRNDNKRGRLRAGSER